MTFANPLKADSTPLPMPCAAVEISPTEVKMLAIPCKAALIAEPTALITPATP